MTAEKYEEDVKSKDVRETSLDTEVEDVKNATAKTPANVQGNMFLDVGNVRMKIREHWWQVW
jgi:hypothetical protein